MVQLILYPAREAPGGYFMVSYTRFYNLYSSQEAPGGLFHDFKKRHWVICSGIKTKRSHHCWIKNVFLSIYFHKYYNCSPCERSWIPRALFHTKTNHLTNNSYNECSFIHYNVTNFPHYSSSRLYSGYLSTNRLKLLMEERTGQLSTFFYMVTFNK